MALHLTQHDIIRFKHQAESMKARAKSALAKADQAVDALVRTSEVSLAAFGFGVLRGRFADQGGVTLLGVPVDLLSGVGFHILGLAGVGGAKAHHLHAFGDGALAAYFASLGTRVGVGWAKGGGAGISGLLDAAAGRTGGASLADEELARMVRAGR
jgi:hypothetical protein